MSYMVVYHVLVCRKCCLLRKMASFTPTTVTKAPTASFDCCCISRSSTSSYSQIIEPTVGGKCCSLPTAVPVSSMPAGTTDTNSYQTNTAMEKATLNSIQKSVWEGQIPLKIVLAPSESRTYDQTDPYLVLQVCPQPKEPRG